MASNVSEKEIKQPVIKKVFCLIAAKLARKLVRTPLASWMGIGLLFIRVVASLGVLCGSYHVLKALINLVQQTTNVAAPQYALSILALEIAFLALMFVITKLCQEE